MHRRQRSLAQLLTRSLATAGFFYALVVVYAVPATLLGDRSESTGQASPDVSSLTRAADQPVWKHAHADRFPGCADIARWPGAEVPTAVVVVRRDGRLQRMAFGEAYRRATSASAADDVWTIGACRARARGSR